MNDADRIVVRWIPLSLASIALLAATIPEVGRADWPQFQGPERDGHVAPPESGAPLDYRSAPRRLWKRPVGAGFSGPVVRGDRLVIFHRVGDAERIECCETATGKTVWKTDTPTSYHDDFGFDEGPRATPTIVAGDVLTFGAQGRLTCVALEDGSKRWHVDTRERYQPRKGFFGAACSPLVVDGRVIVIVGGKENAGIVAFDRASGKEAWRATDDEASYSSPIALGRDDEPVVLCFTRAGAVALDARDGDVRWRFPWRPRIRASVNAATPLVWKGRIFLSTSYGRGAVLIDPMGESVETVWKSDDVLTCHYATPVLAGGDLYGFHGRQEYGPDFRCADPAGARVRWRHEGLGAGTVAVAGDRLLLQLEDGKLVVLAVDPQRYHALATHKLLDGTVRAYPAHAGERTFVRNTAELAAWEWQRREAP